MIEKKSCFEYDLKSSKSTLKNPTLTYISEAEITVIRNTKWFLFKKITYRSGSFNLKINHQEKRVKI